MITWSVAFAITRTVKRLEFVRSEVSTTISREVRRRMLHTDQKPIHRSAVRRVRLMGPAFRLGHRQHSRAQDRSPEAKAKQTVVPVESWADPGLKVTRGLALWLDAGRLNAARKAHGSPGSIRRSAASASGTTARAMAGISPSMRARRSRSIMDGALRFDGETSFLERRGRGRCGWTISRSSSWRLRLPIGGDFRAFLAMHEQGQPDFTSGLTVDMGAGSP